MADVLNGADGGRSRFERDVRGPVEWWVRKGVDRAGLDRILDAPDAVIDGGVEVLKRGRSATVVRAGPHVVKRFQQKRPWNMIVDRVRLDRARKNLLLGDVLDGLGVPTARTLAAGRRLRFGLVRCAYLVTADLVGATTLLASLESVSQAALVTLGGMVARLHAAGFSHRDLKASNVMIDGDRVFLVDLDGIRRRRPGASDLERLFRDFEKAPARKAALASAVLKGYGANPAAFAAPPAP